jgi:tRNA pseudouridine13 synthase
MSVREPVVGDLILPLSKTNVPDHDTPIEVTEENLPKATKQALEGKAFVSGLIYGTEAAFAGSRMGEIERRIIEEENIQRLNFQIVGLREASSKGTRRELLGIFKDFRLQLGESDAHFEFTLNKGCYATTLMREFMKAGISRY